MNPADRIFVAGHRGMVGSALVRRLGESGYDNLLLRTRDELDLEDRPSVARFFREERPDVVFLAAAKVGGIMANVSSPADFLRINLDIGLNVVTEAHRNGVRRLLNLGSSCIYPRAAPQPMLEEHLLTGPLEPTNEAYAIAKIAVLKLCQAYSRQMGASFHTVLPTNLYGPGDNFDPGSSHVLAALLRRFHEAQRSGTSEVIVWGTGTPRREFLHVDDLADACILLMEQEAPPELVNVGSGEELSIRELAELIAEVVGYRGRMAFDPDKPDGVDRKLLDSHRIRGLGWAPQIGLRAGIEAAWRWYRDQEGEV